jgi:AbrB family looped-hinge helix DNA binding protein
MEVFYKEVRNDGKITIPQKIREKLSIKHGDYVKVSIEKMEAS